MLPSHSLITIKMKASESNRGRATIKRPLGAWVCSDNLVDSIARVIVYFPYLVGQ